MDASVNRIASSKDERALLLALRRSSEKEAGILYSLDELKMLVKTAGGIIVDSRIVRRDVIDAAYIIGKGFLEELKGYIVENKIKLLVFDMNNIRPAQVRNLEEKLKCRVVGRNEVILDIFARRARSSEAQIQVELAQLQYILPRLKGLGGVLSRLGGGIGTRGPGEKMLETDRRHVQKRITALKKKLKRYEAHRSRTRNSRRGELLGAVVGYTNAGKSTLINLLAKDDLFVENRLFATLDSYTRSVFLAYGKKILLTDTVGFIRNLPANLIESFRSTLEDIQNADFLLHIIEGTAPDINTNMSTVEAELADLQCSDMKRVTFFNKSDQMTDEDANLLKIQYPDAVIGSALTGEGIDELRQRLIEVYESAERVTTETQSHRGYGE